MCRCLLSLLFMDGWNSTNLFQGSLTVLLMTPPTIWFSCMFVGTHCTCVHMHLGARHSYQESPMNASCTLFFEAGSPANSQLTETASLAGQLALQIPFPILSLTFQAGHHMHPAVMCVVVIENAVLSRAWQVLHHLPNSWSYFCPRNFCTNPVRQIINKF